MPDALLEQEMPLQARAARRSRARVPPFHQALDGHADGARRAAAPGRRRRRHAPRHRTRDARATCTGRRHRSGPHPARAAARKRVAYDAAQLPRLDPAKEYAASDIVTAAMKVFARDPAVVSIDSDLATTSGLEAGVAAVDQRRALNVGVAEANMMGIGEAFAALGHQTWISTFCPFFDWKVLRRIAVGHQERLEAIAAPDGWLSDGHGLDLTMLATAANFETRTNGATHMGNDDNTIFDAIAHLQDRRRLVPAADARRSCGGSWRATAACVYVRVMRTPSAVLYDSDYTFEFGRGHVLRERAGRRARSS